MLKQAFEVYTDVTCRISFFYKSTVKKKVLYDQISENIPFLIYERCTQSVGFSVAQLKNKIVINPRDKATFTVIWLLRQTLIRNMYFFFYNFKYCDKKIIAMDQTWHINALS